MEIGTVRDHIQLKSESLVNELLHEAKISRHKGEKWLNNALEKTRDFSEELNAKVDLTMHSLLAKMNLVSREELTALENKVKDLEKH